MRALGCGRRPGTSGLRCSSAAGQRQLTKRTTAGSKYSTSPSPSVHRFQIDGGLLLLDQASNCLFAYNDTARHVWDLIREGRTEESVISEFARAWGIPLSLARADVSAIIAEWRLQNILVDRRPGKTRPASAKPRSVIGTWRELPEAGWWSEWICTIRGTPIAFAVETELPGPFRLLLAHLETPTAIPRVRLEIRTGPIGERVLLEDGQERMRTVDPAEIIGALFVAVLECTHSDLKWFALMHGAAVGWRGMGIALPGPSGSGKSTLAAGLIHQGYDFLADDVIALSEPHGKIVPWPLPLSIKRGSIEVVGARHPQLQKAAPYRTKGVEARMLVPPSSAWNSEPVPVRCLIFPSFAQGAEPHVGRLSAFETMERLLTDRVWLGNPITEQRMSIFLAWLDRTPSYALSYGSIDDGMRLIAGIVV
jgi:hypothetical protein